MIRLDLPGQRGVIGVPGGIEQNLDLLVAHAVDEPRFQDRTISPAGHDLPEHPLEVLSGLVVHWQHIERILDGDGADAL